MHSLTSVSAGWAVDDQLGTELAVSAASWQGQTCVVLCAGRGLRMRRSVPAGTDSGCDPAKLLLPIHGRPALAYVIDYWRRFTDEFVFVVGVAREEVAEVVTALGLRARFVVQSQPRGIAHAVLQSRGLVTERFTVVLGDCLCRGHLEFPAEMSSGIAVWHECSPEHLRSNYAVHVSGKHVIRVEEKPRAPTEGLCGLGYYFLHRGVFDYIERMTPSPLRDEIEITDTIQAMIDAGEQVNAVRFIGSYVNLTCRADVQIASDLFGRDP